MLFRTQHSGQWFLQSLTSALDLKFPEGQGQVCLFPAIALSCAWLQDVLNKYLLLEQINDYLYMSLKHVICFFLPTFSSFQLHQTSCSSLNTPGYLFLHTFHMLFKNFLFFIFLLLFYLLPFCQLETVMQTSCKKPFQKVHQQCEQLSHSGSNNILHLLLA